MKSVTEWRAVMKISPHAQRLKDLPEAAFAQLGMNDCAYVKEVKVGDTSGWQVYAADGTRVALMEDREVAFAACKQNELEPLYVH